MSVNMIATSRYTGFILLALTWAPSAAFMNPSPLQYRHNFRTKDATAASILSAAATTTDDIFSVPSLQETMTAASTIQTLLERELIKPSKVRNLQTSYDLLDNLHSIALALMEFDETAATERAVELFRYSLTHFDDNPGVRERLSAALRTLGQLDQSAHELFRVINRLESTDGLADNTTLCMLYLDLGFLIDDLLPLPGTGYELIEAVTSEHAAPKFRFDNQEALSCFDCYRKAICLDSECGLAHKKLADALVVIGLSQEALEEFRLAARCMPGDICCATHLHFSSRQRYDGSNTKQAILLMENVKVEQTLDAISADLKNIDDEDFLTDLALKFEKNGVLVFPRAVSKEDIQVLTDEVNKILTSASSANDCCDVADLTHETKAAKHRVHMALPLSDGEKYTAVVSNTLSRLRPFISAMLQCNESDIIPLIGSGFMQTTTSAVAQELHKDVHHWDRHGPFHGMPAFWDCESRGHPRCISIQIQLTDTSLGGKMGSLEVLPGSHRPDTSVSPSCIARAVKDPSIDNGVISIDVPPGSVTIYSSRLWHSGGANDSQTDRTFCFFTLAEDDAESAPAGLIHTMQINDVGKWRISNDGLVKT